MCAPLFPCISSCGHFLCALNYFNFFSFLLTFSERIVRTFFFSVTCDTLFLPVLAASLLICDTLISLCLHASSARKRAFINSHHYCCNRKIGIGYTEMSDGHLLVLLKISLGRAEEIFVWSPAHG